MKVKKILGLVAIALAVFFIVTQPTGAAGSIQNLGNILFNAAQSVTTFFTQLV